jgi:hypothetical protein
MQRILNSVRGGALLPLVALLAIQSGAFSAPSSNNADPVKVELTATKVLSSNGGRETFQPADMTKPGETLQYQAIYRNQSRGSIGNLNATLPIPVGLEVVVSSLKPAGAQASLDARLSRPFHLRVRSPELMARKSASRCRPRNTVPSAGPPLCSTRGQTSPSPPAPASSRTLPSPPGN